MKYIVLTALLIWCNSLFSQQLYTHSNAASLENEANSANGWSGPANITADGTESFDGQFSLRAETLSQNARFVSYNFTAEIGEEYNIVIWAREGVNSTNPAFANWQGLNGFSTTGINGQNWTQYNFTVVATSTSPQIRAYTNPSRNWNAGDHIFIDAISITSTSPSDNEAPQPVNNLSSGSTTENSTVLNWSEPNDNIGVTDYEVFQDGGSLGLTGGATSLNVNGLDPGTNYSFTVVAIDGAGNRSSAGNTENITTLPDSEPPSAVTQLNSQNTTATSTQLFWPASTDNVGVVDYEVFQDGQSIGFTNGSTTINVTNLEPESSYSFTVFARDEIPNISAVSNTEIVNTLSAPDNESPQSVDDLSSTNTTVNSTVLNWTEPLDNEGVVSYEVFQGNLSLGFTGATTFNVSNLDPSSNYSFTVIAIDEAGNRSLSSNAENVLTLDDNESPSPITDLDFQNTTTTSTRLFWSASNDNVGVVDYNVFQDGQSIGFSGGATFMDVTNLSPNSSYTFTVVAQDAVPNTSDDSNSVTVNTPAAPDNEDPSVPTNLQVNNTESSSTELTWTASTDNVGVVDYQIFQDGQVIGLSGGALSFQVNSLVSCTSYVFTVIAIDGSGNTSGSSNSAEVTTPTAYEIPPGTPTAPGINNLSESNLEMTAVTLNWTYNAETNDRILDFEVFQNNSSIGFTSGASTFRVTGLSANTAYSFRVEPVLCSARSTGGSQTINITTLDAPSVMNYDAENANLPTVDWTGRDLFANRNVGIGTTNTQGFRLAVSGNIVAEEIKVALESDWPDYVFKDNYELPSLIEVEEFIEKNGHLIGIPSQAEVKASGILLGEMNANLLKKIEELTLYTIEQDKKIKKLEDDYIKIQKLLMSLSKDKIEY